MRLSYKIIAFTHERTMGNHRKEATLRYNTCLECPIAFAFAMKQRETELIATVAINTTMLARDAVAAAQKLDPLQDRAAARVHAQNTPFYLRSVSMKRDPSKDSITRSPSKKVP